MIGNPLKGHWMRCLVLSDIHSNLEAFRAVLDDAGPVDMIWCLGDVVGYGPEPEGCVELLRSLPHVCIAGNHDWATLGKLDLRDFNPDARDASLWNREHLKDESLVYLESLPEVLTEGDFTMSHGSPRYPIWEYVIYASTAQINFKHFGTPYCFVGHTHTPMSFRWNSHGNNSSCEIVSPVLNSTMDLGDERWIINPGSVGQPRDGDPRASYLLLDTDARVFEHRRVEYDVEQTQAKMMEHDLPLRLVLRLGYGW